MTTQRKEIQNEQFYTQHQTAKTLCDLVKQEPWFHKITTIIEPSAGDGVWLDYINVTNAYDIDPKDPRIQKADFLSTSLGRIPNSLAIGNPPFGRMGTLTLQFFEKCAETVDYVAFIMNASMGKLTMQRRVPKNFHLIKQLDLLNETFRAEGNGQVVKTVFQVWERRDDPRQDSKKNKMHKDFKFITVKSPSSGPAAPAPTNADLAIQTHGSGYGKVHSSNFSSMNTRTHRFMISNIAIPVLEQRLKSLDYESKAKYTVGATCISEEEIVLLYTEKFGE
jgi:hypothetical protein